MVATTQHDLQRTSPEQQGIPSSALLQLIEAMDSQLHELHSFMLLRHGKVVAEGWWSPYESQRPHRFFSISKSFTSTAVGLAIAERRFTLDDAVLSFFPNETPAKVNEHLAAMRVRHLLSMSTGHAEDTLMHLFERRDGNMIKAFFDVPVKYAPGSHFVYNTGASYVLSAIVQKTTGVKLIDYLTPRLFEPLGIENVTWEESAQGINMGGFGMDGKTEDMARLGQLYLQKGMWQGSRILTEDWVEAATSFQVSNGDKKSGDWSQGYCFQFWRCQHNAYRGDGAFGQYCVVMPEQDAVLAITGGIADMQSPLNLVWDILLPAMGNEALPDDAAAHECLTEKLNSLMLPPVEGQTTSPTASQVSGRMYAVDGNMLNIERFVLNFGDSGCTVKVKTAADDETISCGYGVWQRGQSALFGDDLTPIAVSGAWTADDQFTMILRRYETPFFHTIVYHFAGDVMRVDIRMNVDFAPLETLRLMGRVV